MTHEQTSAMWLARWQGLRSSGLKMAEYARREGFNAHSAYRWLRRARRSGQWSDSATQSRKAITLTKPAAAVQFARVAVSDAPAVRSAVLLRLVLTNGRRAELEIVDVPQLGEVLDMLERRA
jgi:transposase-like protein